MDRRQRKTREAIFRAFISLLSKRDFHKITVGEIIEKADIGRATFYAHFETKDDLLKALCEELFCHIFDALADHPGEHRTIFDCDTPDGVFLHLLRHLQRNDNQILQLLTGQNHELFLGYFSINLEKLVVNQLPVFADRKSEMLPDSLWIHHITTTFVETVRWWLKQGMQESPEKIAEYFYLCV